MLLISIILSQRLLLAFKNKCIFPLFTIHLAQANV